jgi:hypothetical protein
VPRDLEQSRLDPRVGEPAVTLEVLDHLPAQPGTAILNAAHTP